MGISAGRGWSLIWFHPALPSWARAGLDWLWAAALLAPVGWWAPSVGTLLAGLAGFLVVAGTVPLWTPLVATPLPVALAAVAGAVAARALRRSARVAAWAAAASP